MLSLCLQRLEIEYNTENTTDQDYHIHHPPTSTIIVITQYNMLCAITVKLIRMVPILEFAHASNGGNRRGGSVEGHSNTIVHRPP